MPLLPRIAQCNVAFRDARGSSVALCSTAFVHQILKPQVDEEIHYVVYRGLIYLLEEKCLLRRSLQNFTVLFGHFHSQTIDF